MGYCQTHYPGQRRLRPEVRCLPRRPRPARPVDSATREYLPKRLASLTCTADPRPEPAVARTKSGAGGAAGATPGAWKVKLVGPEIRRGNLGFVLPVGIPA